MSSKPATIIEETDPRLTFYNQEEALPPNGSVVIRGYWWITRPGLGVLVWRGRSPQCNTNRSIVDRLAAMYPWAEVRYYEVAYVPASVYYD